MNSGPVLSDDPAGVSASPGARSRVDLLDAVTRTTDLDRAQARSDVDRFLHEVSPWKALALWIERSCDHRKKPTREEITRIVSRDIARIDALLSAQVNAIIHHPRFQALEASWRGLAYLVERIPDGAPVKVRVLSASWREVARDQERALEFDQSQLFRKIYEEEFGHPGGEPYGIVLLDYEIHHRPSADHPFDDVEALSKIGSVAAAAFAPFIAGAHPSFFELDRFGDLDRVQDLSKTFEQVDYLKWRSLRQMEDARFLGLTMPRVLRRLPYRDDGARDEPFRFVEDFEEPGLGGYLWGTAVYAFGAVVVRAFAESSWLASIRGVQRDSQGGGVVTGLPSHSFGTDSGSIAAKFPTDVIVTDEQEKELGELGFIPLCHAHDTEISVFYGNQSIQKPNQFDEVAATVNARLSAMLQYMLCVSRFAHYIKVICRDKLGAFNGPSECEEYLRKWLSKYVTANESSGNEVKSKFPLREAKVQVRDQPGKPGSYVCVTHLRPHFQLDQLVSAVRLRTELAPGRRE